MGRKSSAKKRRRAESTRRPRRRRFGAGSAIALAAVMGFAGLLWLGAAEEDWDLAVGDPAPRFALPATDGGTVSLEDLRGENVLLYFNEGAGCDPCFTQLIELEGHLGHLGELDTTLVPVSPNPVSITVAEAARFGIRTPFLIDDTLQVATAYDALGRGHHAGLPGHSFVLVDAEGDIRWQGDYPGMYVSAPELLTKVEDALAA